ncbi:MAG: HigA family addiction module antidote protein [Symploca sp. SIO3E6]|nr:HigA family addiction module antidote protein [Caldora sp. SIO3E6]
MSILLDMGYQVRIEDMHRSPTHPGVMLLEEFLKPLEMTQVQLAQAIGVPLQRVNEIINQKRGVSPETALRLGKYFGVSAEFWLGLQKDCELWYAYQKEKAKLNKIIPLNRANSGVNRLLDWLDGLVDNLWDLPGTFAAAAASARSISQKKVTSEEVAQLYGRQPGKSKSELTIPASMSDSEALAHLIQSTDDESIRKDAIDLLQALDPDHSLFDGVREKDLSIYLKENSIALRVIFIPRSDKRYSVLVQVYPTGDRQFLPKGLKLTVLDENGDEMITHASRARDNLLNRPLILDKGDCFGIKIALVESSITETFAI